MRSLALAAGIGVAATWFLLYLNQRSAEPSIWGQVLYLAVLLCPSACFWLIAWAIPKSGTGEGHGRLFFPSWFAISALGILLGAISLTLLKSSLLSTSPLLFSLITAVYVSGLVLTLAGLVAFPGPRARLFHGYLLSVLMLCAAGAMVIALWFAHFRVGKEALALGGRSSLVIELACLVTLLLGLLSFFDVNRIQWLIGVAVLMGLAIVFVVTKFEIFFPIWSEGVLFWSFVIFCTLSVETILFRMLLASLFKRFWLA